VSKTVSRRDAIIQMLRAQGTITVGEIMEQLGVSEATARRDLDTLEHEKKLIRTYGGAVLETVRKEIPFYRKMDMYAEEKKEIADKAISLIRDGDVIGLTGGSTNMYVARKLMEQPFERLTVVTNALNIAYALAGISGLELIVTGGVNRTQSYELSGPMADTTLERITIHKTFVGADGVDLERGITTFNELEANTNRTMIRQSLESYVLVDHTKMNVRSLFLIDGWQSVTALVTDSRISSDIKRSFGTAGIRLI
jgi:DeoR family transcriptional regulator of aga operon